MESRNHRSAKKQVVSIIIYVLLSTNCSAQSSQDFYNLKISNTGTNSNPKIVAEFLYQEDSTINFTAGIIIDNDSSNAKPVNEETGTVEFDLKPGKYKFSGVAIHMKNITTKGIKLKPGDIVSLKFYFTSSDEPLYD